MLVYEIMILLYYNYYKPLPPMEHTYEKPEEKSCDRFHSRIITLEYVRNP